MARVRRSDKCPKLILDGEELEAEDALDKALEEFLHACEGSEEAAAGLVEEVRKRSTDPPPLPSVEES